MTSRGLRPRCWDSAHSVVTCEGSWRPQSSTIQRGLDASGLHSAMCPSSTTACLSVSQITIPCRFLCTFNSTVQMNFPQILKRLTISLSFHLRVLGNSQLLFICFSTSVFHPRAAARHRCGMCHYTCLLNSDWSVRNGSVGECWLHLFLLNFIYFHNFTIQHSVTVRQSTLLCQLWWDVLCVCAWVGD